MKVLLREFWLRLFSCLGMAPLVSVAPERELQTVPPVNSVAYTLRHVVVCINIDVDIMQKSGPFRSSFSVHRRKTLQFFRRGLIEAGTPTEFRRRKNRSVLRRCVLR